MSSWQLALDDSFQGKSSFEFSDAKPLDLRASEDSFDRTRVGRLRHADEP